MSSASSSSATVLKSCLEVLRRTDPNDMEKNLEHLSTIISNDAISEELCQRVDVPLKVCKDDEANGRSFLQCDHNRDGNSYRSPWSNTYYPTLEDGFRPSEQLRKLELYANEVWDVYRELYYGKSSGSVGSVYLWDKNNNNYDESGTAGGTTSGDGFAGCFLIQHKVGGDEEGEITATTTTSTSSGHWNSIHIVDVGAIKEKKCTYTLTSTIIMSMTSYLEKRDGSTSIISGSLTRQNRRECLVGSSYSSHVAEGGRGGGDVANNGNISGTSTSHIVNIGKFIEDVESEMRSEMDSLYIQKTRNVVDMMRREDSLKMATQGQEHTKMLNEAVLAMAVNRKAKVTDE